MLGITSTRFLVHAFGVAAVTVMVFTTPAAAQGSESAIAHRDLDYVADTDYADDKDQLDVFMPKGAANVPVVVYFHGGALQRGTKAIGEGLARQLTARGVGVVSANYRLSPAVMHPAHMEDATAAFVWTKRNIETYGGDPDRVFVAGHSAGAYLAALMSLDPSYLAAHGMQLADIRGTIPISPFLFVEEQDVAPSRPKTVWGTNEEVWRKASVTPYIGSDKPPMLFIYADGDAPWRREQNDRLKAELMAHDNKVDLEQIADRTHGSVNSRMGEDDDPGMMKIAAFVTTIGVAHAQTTDTRPVTDAMLENPDPADWLNWRRTLDGWGYSPLDQINKGNVDQLQLVWSWTMTPGLSQATPLVHDGVMYIPNPLNVVQALDAVTGDRIWEYRKEFERDPDDSFRARTRSIAIYDDKIYLNTNDAHIVALDAGSGDVAWDHTVADNRLGYRYTSGPIVVKGKIVAGMTGCERYKNGTCFISAHDPQTGGELWRTSTIAGPGEPGGDTWGDLPLAFRAGGDAWIPGSYDPRSNLTYWSTSQAKPWARISRGTDGDALYTNSVLALDQETGELEWYYQFIPGETHDLDDVFESVLIDHRGRSSLFKMGKLGILWEIDRATGRFVAAHDLGYQTLVDVDRQTGEATYRPGVIPQNGVELEFCPDFQGIRNWRASAYHPETQALYIPIHPTCVKGVFSTVEREEHAVGDLNYYANPDWTGWQSAGRLTHPASPDHEGHLIAMDIDSGEILWRHSMATRPTAAALTTAGGLVVSADTDRYLYINDVETGEVLFQTRLPSPVQGFPITYAVNGRQYLAAPVGGGRTPGAPNAMFVFALPERTTR